MAHILVVENESQVLMVAESVLRFGGHVTTSARTTSEAQAIIHSDVEIDLVFSVRAAAE